MPKIRSTQRTVETNTPRLTPPSTAGFGASGRATQQLGNEISKFAGVFDAFAKAEEKNQAANLQSDFYQLQIDTDKQLSDFGNEHKGDGNSYFQGAGSIFDTNGKKFTDKYAGNKKLSRRAQTMVQGAKVQYQRRWISKGQQIQHDRAIIKSTEISASIRGGMLTPENLKEGGIGIVREASDKYFKIVDGLPLSETAKIAAKQNFVKRSAEDVEQFADPSALLKWRSEIGKKLEKEGGQKETSNLTPDEVKRLEQETGLKKGSGEHLEDRGWPVEHNDPRAKKYRKLEGEILSSKVTTKISVNLPKNNVGKALHEASTKHNLDPGLVGQIAKIESNYNPNAKNPRSSARGLGQFINSTGRRYGLRNDGSDSVEAQASALAAHTRDNIAGFKAKVGRDPSPGEVYLAHFAGLEKAIALGKAPANARAVSVLGRKAAKANPGLIEGKTVAQVRAWADRKMGGNKPVAVPEPQPQSLDMQILGAINWKNVEKRHEAEQEQAFLQGVVSGEIKVSAHNSTFMKRYNKAHENILGPEVSLIDNDEAKDYVLKMAANKAPLPKQVFEKLTGHIESEAPEERAKGYALLDNIERDNRAQFNAGGKHANNLSKKLAVYRKLSSFYGNDGAVKRMMLSEERFAKMGIDEMKAEKNKFLKDLDVDDIGDEFDSIFSSQPDVGFSAQQRATATSEYKTLAADAFNQTGDADAAKAIAMHEIKKRYGTTEVTGESVVMKYPPEKFVHPNNIDHVRDNFKAITSMVVDLNRDAFAKRGYELTGKAALSSDEVTERSAEGYFNKKMRPESFLAMDGISLQTEVPDGPKWRIMLEAKVNGETFFVPVDHYFEIDGTAQADHDRLMQFELDNRAIGELEKEGGEGYSPNAPHNLLRRLFGYDPKELVNKKEEIKMRESIENQGVSEQ